ncbi:two-component system response regulator CseB [Streptomyces aidingensis]|uniref:DNA-binding response regulator, OmpR family, contains REC and winged-helix (WHTH) domain n=1 Tax=Streptomyces aidingensis TaxID=910347 RepID=A0A1I1HK19_9ACTN|nr:two-component system response regulator CseB [Streptomyces aidingensis]SFC24417.1 DNA-binding response regulator, OmpR family, contains REC and winged-helix (wHTH) domain [Streptomyces aidingensis]
MTDGSTDTTVGAAGPDGTEVLLVEDDAVLREATGLLLERYGFRVRTAEDGLTGLELFRGHAPDVVLLDVMLPLLDGVSVVRRIRETSRVPVLMISARTDPLDVVQGLEAGADDYVTKPYDTSVLVARIRAALRRAAPPPPAPPGAPAAAPPPLRFGDLTVDPRGMEVRRDGRPLELTPTELRLLLVFAGEPGVVLDRSTLLERVWDYAWGGDTRVVDVHVQRLRGKIGHDRIETVRGFGYKLRR